MRSYCPFRSSPPADFGGGLEEHRGKPACLPDRQPFIRVGVEVDERRFDGFPVVYAPIVELYCGSDDGGGADGAAATEISRGSSRVPKCRRWCRRVLERRTQEAGDDMVQAGEELADVVGRIVCPPPCAPARTSVLEETPEERHLRGMENLRNLP